MLNGRASVRTCCDIWLAEWTFGAHGRRACVEACTRLPSLPPVVDATRGRFRLLCLVNLSARADRFLMRTVSGGCSPGQRVFARVNAVRSIDLVSLHSCNDTCRLRCPVSSPLPSLGTLRPS